MRMKNKKAEQEEARKLHKEQQRANRRGAPNLERKEPTREVKPTILIVCEGENTEPSYFKQFRLSSATIKAVGEGYNTLTLVNRTMELEKRGNYDSVWCVFDKDEFKASDFNDAIAVAEAQGYGVAYSNQAFEYWIILHFEDHQGGELHRKEYTKKINGWLKPYKLSYDGEGSKKITEELFNLLDGIDPKTNKERKVVAIQRAKRIYEGLDHQNPALEESSTTLFRLVEFLMKYR